MSMKYDVVVEPAHAELIAAVRAKIQIRISRAPGSRHSTRLAFLKTRSDLRPGHNLFLYHHPERRDEP